jgi:hypothetical protein
MRHYKTPFHFILLDGPGVIIIDIMLNVWGQAAKMRVCHGFWEKSKTHAKP